MSLFLVVALIFLINILFGYWRSNTRRFSIQWLMAIHIPVALAIGIRLLLLEWNWVAIPIFIAAFAVGQYVGGTVRGYWVKA
ncbi:MAG: hypothetical protein HY528_01185 [Chloroflexi bacterium]|nr:hypothetical protein [Chloroflexota bacterium]